jgi:hypothetical protein
MYLKGREEVVVYHPPKSVSHAHGSRVRGARRVWTAIQHFLENHTEYRLSPTATVTCHGPDKYTDGAVANQSATETTTLLGIEPNVSGVFRTWPVVSDQLPAVLEFAFGWERYPKQQIDPLSFYCSYNFNWRGLPSSQVESFESKLGICIWGRKVILQPTFVFSLPAASPELRRFLSSIESDLPFKMRDDFFRAIVPKVNGKGEKDIKLKKGWLNAI